MRRLAWCKIFKHLFILVPNALVNTVINQKLGPVWCWGPCSVAPVAHAHIRLCMLTQKMIVHTSPRNGLRIIPISCPIMFYLLRENIAQCFSYKLDGNLVYSCMMCVFNSKEAKPH